MEDLPHDILALVFLAMPLSLKDKLAISAVSRRLRTEALETPLLWSSIAVTRNRDLLSLPVILARSQHAPLEVTVRPAPYYMYSYLLFDAAQAAEALIPHSGRLRTLRVEMEKLDPMIPLLDANLFFPQLLELTVYGSTTHIQSHISIYAPALQRVDLRAAKPHDWSYIFTSGLRQLTLHSGSVQLREDSLDALDDPHGIHGSNEFLNLGENAPSNGLWTVPSLRYLELSCHPRRANQILRTLPTAQISEIAVTVCHPFDTELFGDGDLHPLIDSLLAAVGSVVGFTIHDCSSVSIACSSGAKRHMDDPWSDLDLARGVWMCLCENYGAQLTVTSCEVDKRSWFDYAAIFRECQPLARNFVLHLNTNCICHHTCILYLPHLAKVVLTGVKCDLDKMERLILWLSEEGPIRCSGSHTVPVCVCGVVDDRDRNDSWLDLKVQCLTRHEILALEEDFSVTEGSSSARTTWAICSGNCELTGR